jgi:hypothetical protein
LSNLLLLSTADTDLLALRRAEPEGFGTIEALNPARVDADGVQRLATRVQEGAYWAAGLRLLGGRRAFPDGFDALRAACGEAGVPFLAWPGRKGASRTSATCCVRSATHCAEPATELHPRPRCPATASTGERRRAPDGR